MPDYQRLDTPDDGRRMVARWRAMAGVRRPPRGQPAPAALADGIVASRRADPSGRSRSLDDLLARPTRHWPLLEPLAQVERPPGWTTADRERFAAALRAASRTSSGRPSSAIATSSSTSILPRARPDGPARAGPRPRRRRRVSRPDPGPHLARSVRPRHPRRSGSPRSRGSTPSSRTLAGRAIGTTDLADGAGAPAERPGPPLRRPGRGVRHRAAGRSLARPRRSPTGSGACPQAPCEVVAMAAHEAKHSTIALLPPAGGGRHRGPAATTSTRSEPDDATALRGRGARLPRGDPGPPPPDRDRAGAAATCPTFRRHARDDRVRRGLGPVHGAPGDEMGLYSGDLDRIGILSFDAWRAGRLVVDTGHARPGLVARPGDRVHARAHRPGRQQHRQRGRPLHRLARARPSPTSSASSRSCACARRPETRLGARVRHPRLPRHGAGQRRPDAADPARRRRGVGHGSPSPGLSDAGGPSDRPPRTPLAIAARSLLGVLHNRDIRSLELAWTLGVAADWALLVVALLVAYDEGGAVLVGLVSLIRMIPATIVNVVLDTGAFPKPERALIGANLVRAAGAIVVAAAILADATALVFVAVAVASAAGALVRPTVLTLLPAVATSPAELVSANTAGALGESLGTFARAAGRRPRHRAGRRGARGRRLAAALCVVAAGVAAGVRVRRRLAAPRARAPGVDPVRRRRAGAHRPAARRHGHGVVHRPDRRPRRADDVPRDPRDRGAGHGRRGRRRAGRGDRPRRDRRCAGRARRSARTGGWPRCSRSHWSCGARRSPSSVSCRCRLVALIALAVVGVGNALIDVVGAHPPPARHVEPRPVRGVRGARGRRQRRACPSAPSWPRCSSALGIERALVLTGLEPAGRRGVGLAVGPPPRHRGRRARAAGVAPARRSRCSRPLPLAALERVADRDARGPLRRRRAR